MNLNRLTHCGVGVAAKAPHYARVICKEMLIKDKSHVGLQSQQKKSTWTIRIADEKFKFLIVAMVSTIWDLALTTTICYFMYLCRSHLDDSTTSAWRRHRCDSACKSTTQSFERDSH